MTNPHRALILVDVQQEYFDGPLEIQFPPHADSLPRITAAIDAAIAAGLPIAAIQHSAGEGAPAFDPIRDRFALHPEVESRANTEWKRIVKAHAAVFSGTDLLDWLRAQDVDTITLVGYMTNNCIIASAAEAETHGLATEVLSDATGAIHISNDAGFVDAETSHTTLMILLHSNFAAVATTQHWIDAVSVGASVPVGNLGQSAQMGAQQAAKR
ncbi:isochorismatase family protein [Microbacterium sp. CFBP 8790]|uniref:isochorismatase family protein n=1 Tax=unclassified Microbacterium TaxID=2609290 RepID=UPI00177FAF97|nr:MULTISPECIES: isochorismatase family protein [unclassified Microbacterium]MBD8207813.1 isochorismatase family protein [Microbacterium sp. CFBP 8801]MBD8508700.1 isochorismatase family protein [Microbacterium sp. CFBP 8790]